jgi:RNA-directed DNA polymerase
MIPELEPSAYGRRHTRQHWLRAAVERRLREELATLQVEVNEEKSRRVDLTQRERF